MGGWFAVFPTVEPLLAQALAAVVLGSDFGAQYVRLRCPRQRHRAPGGDGGLPHPDLPPSHS